MPAYLIEAEVGCGKTTLEGNNAAIVFAATSAAAVAIAKSFSAKDVNTIFDGSPTVTEIAAPADLEGWTLTVRIPNATTPVSKTVTGAAAATIDSIATLMVTALNADAQIAGAAYNAGTQVLTVAETTDGLGDKTVLVEFKPPAATYADPQHVAGFIASKVHQGAAGNALSVTFAADSYVLPKAYKFCKT